MNQPRPVPLATGDWRLAKPYELSAKQLHLESWYGDHGLYPAYTFDGTRLVVQLNAPVCDDYTELRGTIRDDRIVGKIVSGHLFGSTTVSRVVAMPSRVQ